MERPAYPQKRQRLFLKRRWCSSRRSLPSLPSFDEIESGVEEELLLPFLLLPPLLDEPEVNAEEEEEPLDLLSLGLPELLDEDEELLEEEPEDLEEEP